MRCADVQLLAAEAALGLVSGADRAALLEHLESCERCRSEVLDMVAVADALVVASPQAEPPAGFEQRVLARLGARPRRRRWLVASAAAAAVVLLFVAFAIGRANSSNPSGVREVAMVTPSGRTVGAAYLGAGSPAWVFAAVPGWKDDLTEYRLRVTLDDGTTAEASGAGSWGTLIDDVDRVRSVVLVEADGQVWCAAEI